MVQCKQNVCGCKRSVKTFHFFQIFNLEIENIFSALKTFKQFNVETFVV